MKKGVLLAALALSATSAFAQMTTTAGELCQKISRTNPSNGNICAQLISRNSFDSLALNLASRAVDAQSTSAAIQIMNTTANKRYDPRSFTVCEQILPVNAANVIPCLTTIENATFAPEAIRMSLKQLSGQGSSAALNMLRVSANVYLFPPAAEICEAMISVNSANAIACVQLIANKVTLNGSEQICRTALNNGSSYAIECLRGIVTDYVPMPQPQMVTVDLLQIQDLKRTVMKAKAQLNRGLIENAQRSLDEASASLEILLNGQNPR